MSEETAGPYPPPLGVPVPAPPAAPEADGLGRLSPQQVLLAAGAVAVVAAGAAALDLAGSLLQTVLALACAAASLACGRRGLRTSEETLAGAAAVLLVLGVRAASDPRAAAPLLGALAAVFLLLGRPGRSAVTWPVAAWCTAQLAVLVRLDGLAQSPPLHSAALLGTALAGLAVALRGRRPVAVVALATTVPWWVLGVAEGTRLVWTTVSFPRALPVALLLVAVAAGLVALRSRPGLWPLVGPLLGPRPAVPVLAGVVTGSAVAGLLQATGPAGEPAAGYLGLAVAALVAELASPEPRSLVRPTGLAAASTATLLAVADLLTDGRWTAVALLLLTAAVPALLVAARQPADRPGALPVTVGCLAGAALLAEADGTLGPGWTGPLLLALAVVALSAATLERHEQAEVPLAVSAAVVGAIGVGHLGRDGHLTAPALGLAVLGAALVGYAGRTHRRPARALGCAGLAVAAWLAVADAGVRVPEAYSLPLASVLWLYSGRRLATAESWSSWGPGLVVAYGPSVFLALLEPGLLRVVLVVVAATLTTTAATGWAVRAPFVVGAASLVAVAVGRVLLEVPGPVLVAIVAAGGVLLAVGASYESRRRQAREAIASLADMR